MNKPLFSHSKAVKVATVSNQIEGYQPVKDKEVLKKVKKYISKEEITSVMGREEW